MEIPDFFKLSTFEWRYGDWEKCDCGKSSQRRPVTCSEIKPSNQVEGKFSLFNLFISLFLKSSPVSTRQNVTQRNVQPRASHASVDCDGAPVTGQNAMPSAARDTKLAISRVIGAIRKVWAKIKPTQASIIIVSPKNCMRVPRIQSTKPRQKRPCKSQSPCPRWRRTSWTPCSTKCGSGYQTRQLRCQLRHTRRIIDTVKCETLPKVLLYRLLVVFLLFLKPKVRRKCRARTDCDNAQWSPGNYGPCSATCTNADDNNVVMQRRTLSCRYNERLIGDAYCAAEDKPLEERTCSLENCVPPAKWLTSDWGPCSVTCGRGIMLRSSDCTGGSPCSAEKPETTKVCDLGSCKATTCKDIQRLRKQSLNGNYYIEVNVTFSQLKSTFESRWKANSLKSTVT